MKNENPIGSLSFLEELAARTTQVVFAFDIAAQQFIYINSSFEDVWNKPRESAFENPASLLDSIHPNDKEYVIETFQRISKKVMDAKEIDNKNIEFRIRLPDNSVRWLSLTPYLIGQEPENYLISGFVFDHTALRENEANVQKFAGKKNSLLEILSHDLSGPLVNIQGLSALLVKEVKEYNNPKIDKMLAMIAKTSERSIGMIREFVKQEFLETVNVELIKKRVNLVDVTRQTIEQYIASEKNLAKTFDFVSSADEIFTEIDEYKFNQVINNLISNSIKFTHDGGKIKIRLEDREKVVLFTVSDNGIGIPDKYHKNLFEKFTRAGRVGLKGEPTVGLGMSIIKTIVEWHEGRIWFESKENEGSTFYIELPKA